MERLIKLIEKRKEIGKRKSYTKGGDHNDFIEYNRIQVRTSEQEVIMGYIISWLIGWALCVVLRDLEG